MHGKICGLSFGVTSMSLHIGMLQYQLLWNCNRGENHEHENYGQPNGHDCQGKRNIFWWHIGLSSWFDISCFPGVTVSSVPPANALAHPHVDSKFWDCKTMLWNPPWLLSKNDYLCIPLRNWEDVCIKQYKCFVFQRTNKTHFCNFTIHEPLKNSLQFNI